MAGRTKSGRTTGAAVLQGSKGGAPIALSGPRCVLRAGSSSFPEALVAIPQPPRELYVVGEPAVLREGVAVVGARKATPYGIACAKRFARIASEKGIVVVSGGARGCDRAAHEAALVAGGPTVAFLGGGCDQIYPPEHQGLFQRIVDAGGAVVSENPWDCPPLPRMFRARNRLIAGLAKATLIVEAGLPSGTFSTADEALAAGKEVLAVPGAITSAPSAGANRLIAQGATPIVDDESFEDALFMLFGALKRPCAPPGWMPGGDDPILAACLAEPIGTDELCRIAEQARDGDAASWVASKLAELEACGIVARYPDGRYGPAR